MDALIVVLAILAGAIGIAGSILPALPGPPVSWAGLLVLYLWGSGTNAAGEEMSAAFLLVWLGITVAVSIFDYIVPAYFTKLTGGSRMAGRGAMVGLVAGMFIPPVGIILGTLLGAFLAELLLDGKNGLDSAKSALGALLGFIFGTGAKLITSALMMYYIIVYIS